MKYLWEGKKRKKKNWVFSTNEQLLRDTIKWKRVEEEEEKEDEGKKEEKEDDDNQEEEREVEETKYTDILCRTEKGILGKNNVRIRIKYRSRRLGDKMTIAVVYFLLATYVCTTHTRSR